VAVDGEVLESIAVRHQHPVRTQRRRGVRQPGHALADEHRVDRLAAQPLRRAHHLGGRLLQLAARRLEEHAESRH